MEGEGEAEAKENGKGSWEHRARLDAGVVASAKQALSEANEESAPALIEAPAVTGEGEEKEDTVTETDMEMERLYSPKQGGHSPEKSKELQQAYPFLCADNLHYDLEDDLEIGFKAQQRRLAPHDVDVNRRSTEEPQVWANNKEEEADSFGLGLSEDSNDTGKGKGEGEGEVAPEAIGGGGTLAEVGGVSERVKEFLEKVDAQRPPMLTVASASAEAGVGVGAVVGGIGEARRLRR